MVGLDDIPISTQILQFLNLFGLFVSPLFLQLHSIFWFWYRFFYWFYTTAHFTWKMWKTRENDWHIFKHSIIFEIVFFSLFRSLALLRLRYQVKYVIWFYNVFTLICFIMISQLLDILLIRINKVSLWLFVTACLQSGRLYLAAQENLWVFFCYCWFSFVFCPTRSMCET